MVLEMEYGLTYCIAKYSTTNGILLKGIDAVERETIPGAGDVPCARAMDDSGWRLTHRSGMFIR